MDGWNEDRIKGEAHRAVNHFWKANQPKKACLVSKIDNSEREKACSSGSFIIWILQLLYFFFHLFILFFFGPHHVWDNLSSPTRYQTLHWKCRVLTTGLLKKSLKLLCFNTWQREKASPYPSQTFISHVHNFKKEFHQKASIRKQSLSRKQRPFSPLQTSGHRTLQKMTTQQRPHHRKSNCLAWLWPEHN